MALSARGKKRLTLLVLLIAAGGAGLAALKHLREAQRARMAEEALVEGRRAHEAGEHERAVERLGYYIARNPRDYEALMEFAESRRRTPQENGRHLLGAAAAARRARGLRPDEPAPLRLLLDVYEAVGFMSEQLDTAERLLEIEPNNRRAAMSRIGALAALGREEAALEAALARAEAHPDDLEAQELAVGLMSRSGRRPEEIVAYTQSLVERSPEDAGVRILAATASASAGDLEGARAQARQASGRPVDGPEELERLIRLFDMLGMREEVERTLEAQLAGDLDAATLTLALRRAWKANNREQVDLLRARAPQDLSDAPADLLGWLALTGQEGSGASGASGAEAALRSRSTPEAAGWLALVRGRAALLDGRPAAARELLSKAETSGVAPTLTMFLLGDAEQAMGAWRRAAARWRALAEREPSWAAPQRALSSLLLAHGRLEEAQDAALGAMSAAPSRAESAFAVARATTALAEAGGADRNDLRRVEEMLSMIREQAPQAGEAVELHARLLAATGRVDEARRVASEGLSLDVAMSAKSLRRLAALSERQGWDLTEGLLERSRVEGDDDPQAVYLEALARAEVGRADEGRALLREAMEAAPASERLKYEIRLVRYLEEVDDPAARERILALAERHPEEPLAQLALLESTLMWSDEEALTAAIRRLRAATGESAIVWRVHEARRLLTFEPDEARAAEAAQLLAPAIKEDPSDPSLRALAAEAMMTLGDAKGAAEHLAAAVDADPLRVGLAARLIDVLQQAGMTAEAERRLRTFAEREDIDDLMRRRRAALLVRQGLWGLALEDLKALARRGEERDVIALAQLHAQRGELEEAQALFERLTSQPEPSGEALAAAAEFYAERGDVEAGEALLERLASRDPQRTSLRRARFLERHGRVEQARAALRALAAQGESPAAWNELARMSLRTEDLDAARRAIDEGRRRFPDDETLRVTERLVRLLESDGLDDEAAAEIAAALDERKAPAAARRLLDLHRRRQSDALSDKEYLAALREATNESPTFFPAWRALVSRLIDVRRYDEAAAAAQEAAAALPASAKAARLATEALSVAGRLDEALAMAERWRRRSMVDPFEAEVALARLRTATGDASGALRALAPHQARIESEAESAPGRVTLLARLMLESKRVDDAHGLLWPLARRDPAWARRYVGLAEHALWSPEQARAWIERGAGRVGAGVEGALTLGQAWYDLALRTRDEGDWRRVLAALAPAQEDPEAAARASILLAPTHEQLGEAEEAERHYRRAIEAHPEQAALLNNLAYLLVKQGGAEAEALELARRAVALSPGDANFLDTLGAALLAAEQPEEAEETFRRGLRLAPESAPLLLGLAAAQAAQGLDAEAQATLRRYEALGVPEGTLSDELRGRLERARESTASPQVGLGLKRR